MDISTAHMDSIPRRVIASFTRYEEAQELVDRLSDNGFPVDRVAIVGRDLQYVEQVTGRLNALKAAMSGAISGLVIGFLFGSLFAIWFAHDGTSFLGIILYWLIVGAVISAIFSLIGYALMGGRRNFTSIAGMAAQRYDVMVDQTAAAEAVRVAITDSRAPRPKTSTA